MSENRENTENIENNVSRGGRSYRYMKTGTMLNIFNVLMLKDFFRKETLTKNTAQCTKECFT